MHREVSLLIVSQRFAPSAVKSCLRHLSPSLNIAPSTFPRISRPLGFAASVSRIPFATAPLTRLAPFSLQTSMKVALPALSPMTPQFPQARSAWRGILYLQRRQLDLRPYPASSSSSMEIPLCPPSYSMMNWPLSISSLWTLSGSTPNLSVIILRARIGLTEPPQLTPIMITLSRLICLRLASSRKPITSHPLTVTPIFLIFAPSRYFLTSFGSRRVPQWSEPAVCARSLASVTSIGWASYRSVPFWTARIASTAFVSSACFQSAVTAPPSSAFFLMSASLVHA